MLRGKLIKKGLAKVMALTLAVSMAMPGTALAAATQPPLDEAAVDIYEEEGAEEAAVAEESAEQATAPEESAEEAPALTNTAADEAAKETEDLTEEGSETEAPTEEAPEDENPAEGPEEDVSTPADPEGEAAPADPEDDGTHAGIEEASAVNEEPADMETDISAPATQEYSAAPAAASPKMNKVTSITLLGSIRTVFLGLTGRKTFQMDVEVTYDTSTSYETNEPVFYKSTDESVVTVDSNGKVTAVGTGYAYVQVYTKTETSQIIWISRVFSVSEAAYAVNFDLNGGTLAEELKGSAADMYYMYKYGTGVSSGKSVTLQTNIWNGTETVYIVKRDGYVFDGWTETKDGEDIVDTYYYPSQNTTLYAKWKRVYFVKFDLNGGKYADGLETENPSAYKLLKDGKKVNAGMYVYVHTYYGNGSETKSVVTRGGCRFAGWTETKNGSSVVYDFYYPKKDITLYAKWEVEDPSALGKTTRGDMFNLANNVKVTWKEVTGAKYYKVYREGITDPNETREEPVIVTTNLVGWDAQPGLTNGHAYRYKIVASLTGKDDSSGDSPLSYSKLMYRLKTVVIRSAKNTAPGKVTVRYDKTTSGDSYVLQYSTNKDMTGARTKVVLGANNTSYTIGGLKKGKTYYISIRVRKKVNGIDYYTTFGVPKKVTITK